jgi:hypothetical protein
MMDAQEFHRIQAERIRMQSSQETDASLARGEIAYQRNVRDRQAGIGEVYRGRRVEATGEAYARQSAWEAQRPDMLLATDEQKANWEMAGSRADMVAAQRQRELEAREGRDTAYASHALAGRQAEETRQSLAVAQRNLSAGGASTSLEARAGLESQVEKAKREAEAADARRVQTAWEVLSQEERIKQVRISAADESISKTQQEINLRQKLIDQDRGRLMTAKDRIANMGEGEQAEFGRVLLKARHDIRTLTSEEHRLLSSVDTEETANLRRGSAEFRSRAFFERYGFGREENERIARNEEASKNLVATLKDDRELRQTVERDDNEVVRKVGERFREIINERDRLLLDKIQRELESGDAKTRQYIENKLRQLGGQRPR